MCLLSHRCICERVLTQLTFCSAQLWGTFISPQIPSKLFSLYMYLLYDFSLMIFFPLLLIHLLLFPLMLCFHFPVCCHFWVALWGMFGNVCMHVQALVSYHCVRLCGFVRVHVSQPICMEMKWNDRSFLRNGHFNGRYCWVFMICCWGFDSVIWPSGDLTNLVFPPLSFLLTISLPPPGFHFTVFFPPLASYHFIRLKSLSPTLKLATKRQEYTVARCSCPDWNKGTLSTLPLCLGSDNVALFEIASCKDNCACRCCNKLMTVLTLKFGSTYSEWNRWLQQLWFFPACLCEIKSAGVCVCDTKCYIYMYSR